MVGFCGGLVGLLLVWMFCVVVGLLICCLFVWFVGRCLYDGVCYFAVDVFGWFCLVVSLWWVFICCTLFLWFCLCLIVVVVLGGGLFIVFVFGCGCV